MIILISEKIQLKTQANDMLSLGCLELYKELQSISACMYYTKPEDNAK